MQCAATTAVTVGAASGLRAWLRACGGAWLTPRRYALRHCALLSLAVLASGVTLAAAPEPALARPR